MFAGSLEDIVKNEPVALKALTGLNDTSKCLHQCDKEAFTKDLRAISSLDSQVLLNYDTTDLSYLNRVLSLHQFSHNNFYCSSSENCDCFNYLIYLLRSTLSGIFSPHFINTGWKVAIIILRTNPVRQAFKHWLFFTNLILPISDPHITHFRLKLDSRGIWIPLLHRIFGYLVQTQKFSHKLARDKLKQVRVLCRLKLEDLIERGILPPLPNNYVKRFDLINPAALLRVMQDNPLIPHQEKEDLHDLSPQDPSEPSANPINTTGHTANTDSAIKISEDLQTNALRILGLNAAGFNLESANYSNLGKKGVFSSNIRMVNPHLVLATEVKTAKDNNFFNRKGFNITKNLSTSNIKGGAFIAVKNELVIEKEYAAPQDVVILRINYLGTKILVAAVYINPELKKNLQLKATLQTIDEIASTYDELPILVYGDLNLPLSQVQKILNSFTNLTIKLKLRINSNYTGPFDESLHTRGGLNNKGKFVTSRLDYVITNVATDMKVLKQPFYDHCFFIIFLKNDSLKTSRKVIKSPNKANMSLFLLERVNTIITKEGILQTSHFSKLMEDLLSNNNLFYNHKPARDMCHKKILDLNLLSEQDIIYKWTDGFNTFANEVISLRFSPLQRRAFSLLRVATKYNTFAKRDGSIISCTINKQGEIISSRQELASELIGFLRNNDTLALNTIDEALKTSNPLINLNCESQQLCSLPLLNDGEIGELIEKLSRGKALAFLPMPDLALHALNKLSINLEFLNCLWNPEWLLRFPIILKSRLICLNKIHPDIPKPSDMRPICVTSSLFKLIELRFAEKLSTAYWNITDPLAKTQVGFLPHMMTNINIYRLHESILQTYENFPERKRWYSNGTITGHWGSAVIFFDFRQAFNSINRKRLFRRIEEEQILSPDETQFLEWLYNNQVISMENSEFTPLCGVPQGGSNSPLLFDFTIYFMMKEVETEVETLHPSIVPNDTLNKAKIQITKGNTNLFADDLSIHLFAPFTEAPTLQSRARDIIEILEAKGKGWGLSLNRNKCSIVLECTNHKTALKYWEPYKHWFKGIPITANYKYLGVLFSGKLSIEPHISNIKRKVNFLQVSFFAYIRKTQDLNFSYNIWQLFVRPLLDYCSLMAMYSKQSLKLDKLYRSSIRAMLGLKKNSANELCDLLIQYPYQTLGVRLKEMVTTRWYAYAGLGSPQGIGAKVDMKYKKLDMKCLPQKMIRAYNTVNSHQATCLDHNITLTAHHLKLIHSLDIKKLVEETLAKAEDNHNQLNSTLRATDWNDETKTHLVRILKKKLGEIRKAEIEKWDEIFSKINKLVTF